jgi:hypothetical protein
MVENTTTGKKWTQEVMIGIMAIDGTQKFKSISPS